LLGGGRRRGAASVCPAHAFTGRLSSKPDWRCLLASSPVLGREGLGQRQLFRARCNDARTLKRGNRAGVAGAEKSRA
jgi:hypothetical protein